MINHTLAPIEKRSFFFSIRFIWLNTNYWLINLLLLIWIFFSALFIWRWYWYSICYLFVSSALALLISDPKDATFDLCDSWMILYVFFVNFRKKNMHWFLVRCRCCSISMDFQLESHTHARIITSFFLHSLNSNNKLPRNRCQVRSSKCFEFNTKMI